MIELMAAYMLAATPTVEYALVIRDAPTYNQLFRMGPTACLIGPMEFQTSKGELVFKLEDGVDYPTGCKGKQ